MPRLAPLLLILIVGYPAVIATPVSADPRDHSRASDYRADDRDYGDDDDDDDGSSDLYGRHGESDDDDDDEDDYGAYGRDGDTSEPDSSDGMRT
jgi:hypothetical protein